MGEVKKKAIGLTLVWVLSLGSISSIIDMLNTPKAVYAISIDDEDFYSNEEEKKTFYKVRHIINSMLDNYWGVKNQATWETYIKEAKVLLSKIPDANGREFFSGYIDYLDYTIKYIARVNHVEKSYDVNYHGIKNASQWRIYLNLAKEAKDNCPDAFNQLGELYLKVRELDIRYDDMEKKVKAIEDVHYSDLARVQAKLDLAKASKSLTEAKSALEDANKLGTHDSTTKIKNEIIEFINSLK